MKTLESVLATLRRHKSELHRRGVRHAAVFGSIARGEDTRTSDVDVLVTLDQDANIGILEYVGIEQYLSRIIGRPVDIAQPDRLKPLIRRDALRDRVDAF